MVRVDLLVLVGLVTQRNGGIRFRTGFFNILLTIVMVLLRVAMLGYTVTQIYPEAIQFVQMTWSLNQVNWWKSPDEPFFASYSLLNSLLANYLWLLTMVAIYIVILILPLLLVTQLLQMVRRKGLCKAVFRIGGQVLKGVYAAIWKLLIPFILGTSFDSLLAFIHIDSRSNPDSNTETANNLLKRKISFKRLYFDEELDCAICMEEFCDKD
mmetsp:Transcript_17816/g.30205  ORF Transcript_17816/g.30205 Transcript_17816/m.30205 type:complete len:211 (+) Transcript_17816:353-985(+)